MNSIYVGWNLDKAVAQNQNGCHISSYMTYLLNISEFVYFVWGLSPPKRRVVQWQNFARRRVQTMCKTSAGFYDNRGRRYQKMTFF